MSGSQQSHDIQRTLENLTGYFNFLKKDVRFKDYQDAIKFPGNPEQTHIALIEDLIQQSKTRSDAMPAESQEKLISSIENHLQVNYWHVQMNRLAEILATSKLTEQQQAECKQAQTEFNTAFASFFRKNAERLMAEKKEDYDKINQVCLEQVYLLEHHYQVAFNLARKTATDKVSQNRWLSIFTTPPYAPVTLLGDLTLFDPSALKNVVEGYAPKGIFKLLPFLTKVTATVSAGKESSQHQITLNFCPWAGYPDTLRLDFTGTDQGFTGYLQDVAPNKVSVEPEQFILVAAKLFNAYLMMYMAAERSLLESTARATEEDLKKLPVTLYMDLLDANNPHEPPAFTEKRMALAKAAYTFFQASRQDSKTHKHPLIDLKFVNDPPSPLPSLQTHLQEIVPPIQGQDFAAEIKKSSRSLLEKHAKACEPLYKKLEIFKVLPQRFRPQPR